MKSHLLAGDPIDGVALTPLTPHRDERGAFTEVFQRSWGTEIDPCQWSVVHSGPRVFRGCHLHVRHDEYFCLLQGEASLGLLDERSGSPTFGNWQLYRLHGEDLAALTFPAHLVHGWYFHTQALHLQAVSESYADYGHDDNLGVHWSDPELGIPWDFADPILAPRAAGFGSLAALRSGLAARRAPAPGS